MDEEVIQRQDGITIKLEMKRGTSTNDRDKVKTTVHGQDMQEARMKSDVAITTMEQKMAQLRSFQPDDEE